MTSDTPQTAATSSAKRDDAAFGLVIDEILQTARTLNDNQIAALSTEIAPVARREERLLAKHAAMRALRGEGLDTAIYDKAVIDIFNTAGPADVRRAASHAVRAHSAAHLMSEDGFTQEHFDILMAPYNAAVAAASPDGPLWDENRVNRAVSLGYVSGSGDLAVLGSDTSPADGTEAARRMLNADNVKFAGIRFGYPSYEKE